MDQKLHLHQLRALKLAYETLTREDPYLPPQDSPLPALLAIRNLDTCIKQTQACKVDAELDFSKTNQLLDQEQIHLKDAKSIQTALESRILSLHEEIEERTQKSQRQVAKDMLLTVKKKKTQYDVDTKELVGAFNEFIDEHLAAMLAAEELGGPIVGGLLDVDEEALEAGFSAQGKAKKLKESYSIDKRQRRIDEIWGPQPAEEVQEANEPRNERHAAAAELRGLTESLLNNLVEAEEGDSGPYVELRRESAASRFLIRSKVAQYHFNDARKLRLVNFGGEIL